MSQPTATPQTDLVQEFNRHESRTDGARVLGSLKAGLDLLMDLMLDRVAIEPGTMYGVDSMIMPTSFVKGHLAASFEIELFQTVESAESAQAKQFVRGTDQWFARWLTKTRLPEHCDEPAVIGRLAAYRGKGADARRLAFETALARALPQTTQAPLVLFRLFPLAVDVATAIAFGNSTAAAAARKLQQDLLPSVADCHDCRGALLENGEECRQCGNPLWKFDWLTAE